MSDQKKNTALNSSPTHRVVNTIFLVCLELMRHDGSVLPLFLSEIPVPEEEMKGQLKSV